MPLKETQDQIITLKFGGGQNSSASEDDINPSECAVGHNFVLDLNNKNLRPRKPIVKLGAAPNGQEIRGFATLVDSDGAATILVQAGATVYNWSSIIGFVNVGTVSATAKLRGHAHHYWALGDYVIITDVNLIEKVWTWDGSAFTAFTENLAGDFKAKYCWIDNERVQFANVISNSTATPHMIVTSALSDPNTLSVSSRPSSALGASDPFYLLTPDLRPINGMIGFYKGLVVSTEKGSLYKIVGSDSTDTEILPSYPRSGATGVESFVHTGNDIFYGRMGRLESVTSTDTYGDISSNDLTTKISDEVDHHTNWQIAYNSRTQRVYAHAVGEEEIWQYSKDFEGTEISPWVRFTTQNSFAMNPSAMMSMIDPVDGLEYIYMGDASGNLYKIEGTLGDFDCGENNIECVFRSALFKIDGEKIGETFTGHISYRAAVDATVTIKVLCGGSDVSTDTTTLTLKGTAGGSYFGGSAYFGGDFYFGAAFDGRFRREHFTPAGRGEELQIEVSHDGAVDFEINEIVLRFESRTNNS